MSVDNPDVSIIEIDGEPCSRQGGNLVNVLGDDCLFHLKLDIQKAKAFPLEFNIIATPSMAETGFDKRFPVHLGEPLHVTVEENPDMTDSSKVVKWIRHIKTGNGSLADYPQTAVNPNYFIATENYYGFKSFICFEVKTGKKVFSVGIESDRSRVCREIHFGENRLYCSVIPETGIYSNFWFLTPKTLTQPILPKDTILVMPYRDGALVVEKNLKYHIFDGSFTNVRKTGRFKGIGESARDGKLFTQNTRIIDDMVLTLLEKENENTTETSVLRFDLATGDMIGFPSLVFSTDTGKYVAIDDDTWGVCNLKDISFNNCILLSLGQPDPGGIVYIGFFLFDYIKGNTLPQPLITPFSLASEMILINAMI